MDHIIEQVPYRAPNQPQVTEQYIAFQLENDIRPGIPLWMARLEAATQLQYGEHPFSDMRAKSSVRVQPVGYRLFSRQKHSRQLVRGRYAPLNRVRAAKIVAEVVEEFIQEAQQTPQTGPAYRFGPGGIQFDDIVLLGLVRVSVASYQPVLAYRPRHRV